MRVPMTLVERSTLLRPRAAVLAILLVAAATVAGAWLFQLAGVAPCELCLKERWPYYGGAAAAAVVWFSASREHTVQRFALIALAALFAVSAVVGAYHAGVEWGLWPGPSDCTGDLTRAVSMDDFARQLQSVKVVRCDVVAVRVLGLSLAAWNAVISGGLTGLALVGARNALKPG